MTSRDIFVVGTARAAIGTFGGALKDVANTQLATTAVKAALTHSGVAPDAIGHVVMGNVIPTDTKDCPRRSRTKPLSFRSAPTAKRGHSCGGYAPTPLVGLVFSLAVRLYFSPSRTNFM